MNTNENDRKTFELLDNNDLAELNRILRKLSRTPAKKDHHKKFDELPACHSELESMLSREMVQRDAPCHPDDLALFWCSDCGLLADVRKPKEHALCDAASKDQRENEKRMYEHCRGACE